MSIVTIVTLLLFFVPLSSFSSELNSGDSSWILTSTALVLFMTLPGLALFYGGLVRSRNAAEIVTKNLGLYAIACVMYLVCGFFIMYCCGT